MFYLEIISKGNHEYLKIKKMEKETILCATITYNDKLICGYRHSDCYELLYHFVPNIQKEDVPDRTSQGFLTSNKRVVDRKEAWIIAKASNQIRYGLNAASDEEELISENLY